MNKVVHFQKMRKRHELLDKKLVTNNAINRIGTFKRFENEKMDNVLKFRKVLAKSVLKN